MVHDSYHYTKLYSYWMNWLNLRDILNTACNIMSAAYKGWVGRLTMPVDTVNQVVCTVSQTDGHSNPDHTTQSVDIEWNSLGPHATLLMLPSGRVCDGPAWLDRVSNKPSVKADLLIYSICHMNCVTECLSAAIIMKILKN